MQADEMDELDIADHLLTKAGFRQAWLEPEKDDDGNPIKGKDLIGGVAAPDQWQALLPTDEERWAIKALRAGLGAEKRVCVGHGRRWVVCCDELTSEQAKVFSDTYVDVGGRYYAGYDTSIAALAAAGRVLEEGEQRG